ncbi:TPA: hypothetical protein RRG90_005506 [Klebsiella pneumoniae]|uniref:hypothetical protein n=1 Tax=Enterobacteriaceae TaxID=543 RepID=UPI001887FCB1|nr:MULTISPECIES: hypothetical protein [Enterobacteriaceae]MCH4291397.1 hypothetical protein [Enterobacter kobei]CAF9746636.1 hypothetical protein AI3070V1_5057 [Klebsiella pneumoniae]CAH6268995.1 hypothetical protein AI3070V1_5057 [Klebsiella pneumoniae]HDH0220204.1 hypothetical protein [Klebsiella pneumoniae]HDY8356605.1 hypothetical protein [Klebsiella pneumoniae]
MIKLSNLVISAVAREYTNQITGIRCVEDEEDVITSTIRNLLELLWPSEDYRRNSYNAEQYSSRSWQWSVGTSRRDIGSEYGYLLAKGRTDVEVKTMNASTPCYSVDIEFGEGAEQYEWAGLRPQMQDSAKLMRLTVRPEQPAEWTVIS